MLSADFESLKRSPSPEIFTTSGLPLIQDLCMLDAIQRVSLARQHVSSSIPEACLSCLLALLKQEHVRSLPCRGRGRGRGRGGRGAQASGRSATDAACSSPPLGSQSGGASQVGANMGTQVGCQAHPALAVLSLQFCSTMSAKLLRHDMR